MSELTPRARGLLIKHLQWYEAFLPILEPDAIARPLVLERIAQIKGWLNAP